MKYIFAMIELYEQEFNKEKIKSRCCAHVRFRYKVNIGEKMDPSLDENAF